MSGEQSQRSTDEHEESCISVYAKLPSDPDLSAEDIWKWTLTLKFPIHNLRALKFAKKPYKWIRYATGVVLGTQGDLCEAEAAESNLVDYEADSLPDESTNVYYHIPEHRLETMLPFDPEFLNAELTSTARTRRSCYFRDLVRRRDGDKCVITGLHRPYGCDAAHLVPFRKGDSYIENLTRGRRQDQTNEEEVIDKINDIRNGIFVNKFDHTALGRDLAILKTPNFAMDSTDVIFAYEDGSVQDEEARRSQGKKYTSHLFNVMAPGSTSSSIVPSGSSVLVPEDGTDWPPDIIFDVVYAAAVVRHFRAFADEDVRRWQKTYYPDGPMTDMEMEERDRRAHDAEKRQKREKNDEDRRNRLGKRSRDEVGDNSCGQLDNFDLLLLIPYMGMQPEAKLAHDRKCWEEAEAREHQALGHTVRAWRDQVSSRR